MLSTAVNIAVEDLKTVIHSDNNSILFSWQPFTTDNITKLAVLGYLLQCDGEHDTTWQYTIWNATLSMATVNMQHLQLNTQPYSCYIVAFNSVGFGIRSNSVQLQIYGE